MPKAQPRRIVRLDRSIDRFLAEFEVERGATAKTLQTYRQTLEHMTDALPRDANPLAVTRDDLIHVLQARWGRRTNTTRATRISEMRTFWTWFANRYKTENPAADLARPRKERPERRRLTTPQVHSLIEACETPWERLIIRLLSETGMRASDLRQLRWREVHQADGKILVQKGKGNKGRTILVGPALCEYLSEVRADQKPKPAHYVIPFTHANGTGELSKIPDRQCGESTFYKIVQRVAARTSVLDNGPCSPHDLRRWYGRVYLQQNREDIKGLQQQLGHARIETTVLYTGDLDEGDIRGSVDRIKF